MASEQPSVTVNNIKFCYAEDRTGRRKIIMWRQGVADDRHTYNIDPDPHNNTQYNRKQAQFYLEAATAIAAAFNGNWVQQVVTEIFNEEFTFNLRTK